MMEEKEWKRSKEKDMRKMIIKTHQLKCLYILSPISRKNMNRFKKIKKVL
jgi:hypothetical protein